MKRFLHGQTEQRHWVPVENKRMNQVSDQSPSNSRRNTHIIRDQNLRHTHTPQHSQLTKQTKNENTPAHPKRQTLLLILLLLRLLNRRNYSSNHGGGLLWNFFSRNFRRRRFRCFNFWFIIGSDGRFWWFVGRGFLMILRVRDMSNWLIRTGKERKCTHSGRGNDYRFRSFHDLLRRGSRSSYSRSSRSSLRYIVPNSVQRISFFYPTLKTKG